MAPNVVTNSQRIPTTTHPVKNCLLNIYDTGIGQSIKKQRAMAVVSMWESRTAVEIEIERDWDWDFLLFLVCFSVRMCLAQGLNHWIKTGFFQESLFNCIHQHHHLWQKGSISFAFQTPLTTRQLDHKIDPPSTVLEFLLRRDSCLAVLCLIFNILRKFCTDGNEYESTSSTKKLRFYG